MSDPSLRPQTPMTVDQFLAWSETWEDGERYELLHGEPVLMSPERSVHALVKFAVARALYEAVKAAGLPCTVYPDGMTVRISDDTAYVLDTLLRCGEPLPGDTVVVPDPMVVVEVLSPGTRSIDLGKKAVDYLGFPTLEHYLVVHPGERWLLHHARQGEVRFLTTILRDGRLTLDPPGLSLDLADIFAEI